MRLFSAAKKDVIASEVGVPLLLLPTLDEPRSGDRAGLELGSSSSLGQDVATGKTPDHDAGTPASPWLQGEGIVTCRQILVHSNSKEPGLEVPCQMRAVLFTMLWRWIILHVQKKRKKSCPVNQLPTMLHRACNERTSYHRSLACGLGR